MLKVNSSFIAYVLKTALILIPFTYSSLIQAQSQTPIVHYETYDYLNDADKVSLKKEKFDSRVGLKIINVNKKLVDINKDINKTSFNEETPALFETFAKSTAPAPAAGGNGLAPAALAVFNNNDILQSNIPEPLRTKISSFQQDYTRLGTTLIQNDGLLKKFGEEYTHGKAILQYHSDLISLQNICNRAFNDILNDVNNLTLQTFTNAALVPIPADKALLLIGSNYTQNRGIVNRYITKTIDNAKSFYDQINAAFLPSNLDKLSIEEKALKDTLNSIETSLKRIKNPNTQTRNLIDAAHRTKLSNDLGNSLKDLEELFDKADINKLYKDLEALGSAGRTALFDTYDWFNVSNYTYYVSPQTIDKDLTVISVAIEPKENVPCGPLAKSFELRVRAKGGIKIDFSTGLFANFGGNNFLDQTYRYDSVSGQPDKNVIVQNKTKNIIFPSVGALMHIYKRNGKDAHFSGTFGISTKDLETINYHLGGSLIFGYSQRFILSAGATLTKATLISDSYEVGQVVNKPTEGAVVPTDTFNRLGFFVAFSYNLTAK
ncbi:hypothetical protein QTN47_14995 [Danxiaibacter flavus]|uniref:Outer membrane protein beta-barrel domain-containing protein n=1 Tax=Danxiaibacter flavus TaxID=3049108 RepID=A0ABV3ZG03_9BACT|nr:hypothetical protein QNM32_15005 [Chitinophagaceae bacterium DXS]